MTPNYKEQIERLSEAVRIADREFLLEAADSLETLVKRVEELEAEACAADGYVKALERRIELLKVVAEATTAP